MTPTGMGSLSIAPQTSPGRASVRKGRTVSSLPNRRAAMMMMVQKRMGDVSYILSGSRQRMMGK